MGYYFYVIRSEIDKSLYKGITGDITIRVNQYNSGRNRSTQSKKSYTLVYCEELKSRIDARKREKYFKSGIGREILYELFTIEYVSPVAQR